MMTVLRALSVSLLALALLGSGCRTTDELVDEVNAIVVVVGVDDDQAVTLRVDDKVVASTSDDTSIVEFKLALSEGEHTGTIEVARTDRELDEDSNARCGSFTLSVVFGDIDTAGIVVDDLERCRDDDDDDDDSGGEDQGKADEGEGEGSNNDSSEGEGEDIDDGSDGDGEGEG